MDQQMFWNDLLLNPVEAQNLPDSPVFPSDTNMPYVNLVSEESADLSMWNSGGPSSSRHPLNHGGHEETKTEHGWESSLTINGGRGSRMDEGRLEATNMLLGTRTDERRSEAIDMLSLENVNINLSSNQVDNGQSFSQNSNAEDFLQNSDHHAGHVGTSSQVLEAGRFLHPYNPSSSGSVHVPSSVGSSNACGSSSRAVGFLTENGEGRQGSSFDGRRLSCKRKSIEEAPAQCSASGSSSCLYPSINPPEEQLNPRIGTTVRVGASDRHPFSVAGNAESSQRNCRIRINPAQHSAPPPSPWPPGNNLRLSDPWSTHQASSLLIPFNQSLESGAVVASGTSESQPHALPVPGLVQNMHPFTWNGASSSRTGSSSRSPAIAGERSTASREETNSRSMPMNNISEHSIFAPTTDFRHLVQDPTSWSLANGSISIPGHVAPTSRAGTTSRVHQSPGPTWVPHQNPPGQYHRGLAEAVRQPLFPSGGSGSGQSINIPPQRSAHSNMSQEISYQSAAVVRGHQQPYVRSALLMDRQNDGVLGVPLSMRSLAAAREGRSRVISEIRNALQLVRRGENIRFEDFLLFDHSIFYGGAAELHDRHRDMRLDVDNMSYEELLALEEQIGNVSTGLSEETVLKCLKQRIYISLTEETPKEVEPCCVCQEEYVEGEVVGRLDCGHDFHTACIKQWLMQKNLCPICKTTGLVT